MPADPVPPSLRDRVLGSARWVLIRTVVANLLQVAQVVVLARLLGPVDFGDIAIVMVTLTLLEGLSQTGIDVALIRHRGSMAPHLDAAWTLQAVRGIALALLVLALAKPLAAFVGSPTLPGLLMLAAAVPVLDGLRGMAGVIYTRDLDQARLTVAEVAVSTVSFVTSIGLVVWLRSPLGLVLNLIVFTSLKTIVSYLIHPHRPRFTRHWSPLRPFLRYGVFFNLGSAVAYVAEAADKFLIGRLLGRYSLGLYDRAFLLSNFGVNQLPRFMAAVVFPGFVSIATDPERYRRLRRRYLRLAVAVLVGGCTLLFAAADPLVRYGLGERFVEALPCFRILVVYALCRGLTLTLHPLCDLAGRPHVRLVSYLVHLAALLLTLPGLAASHGLGGAAASVTIAGGAGLLVTLAYVGLGATSPHPQRECEERSSPEESPRPELATSSAS